MKLTRGATGAFIEAGEAPKSKGERPRGPQRERRVAGSEWDNKLERRGGLHDTHRVCARDCLCSSTQLQMFLGFLSFTLTLSLRLSNKASFLFYPIYSSSMKRNSCDRVWSPIQPEHTRAHTKNRKFEGMEPSGRDLHSSERESNNRITVKAKQMDSQALA